MTPKEKARDLINQFNFKVLDTHLGGGNRRVIDCAMLAVDEILIAIRDLPIDEVNWNYWIKVQQELLNLKYN